MTYRCPACGDKRSTVIETRWQADRIHRRRKCFGCGVRYSTNETLASDGPQVKEGGPLAAERSSSAMA